MTALIESTALTRRFPSSAGRDVTVLDDVTLTIGRGELVTIVGPSGSGKSTLLQCLSGLDAPTAGTVRIDGTDLATLRGDALAAFRRDHLGFVFQSYNLIPALTAFENVALPLRLSTGSVDRAVVRNALDAVGLTAVARHRPGQLSGGQQQRVAIARTIVTAPDVVFADEPTGALDTESGARVLELLRAAASGRRSVVMVTHDLEAAALGDRVLVLRDGRLHRELVAPSVTDVLAAVSR
ncbi:ABC transporter ATP-binding protein [Curtobacterium sp. VKM Ac-2861]|jgi:putative ABC transport system ATP-binding protein|uniref:ABC transporter ATP-binding protein n=1 Tax=unclassified Curtobacterium TaxID=257496 RepID=UPI0015640BD8|nr:ABC transporter ATP-binding protein [Curtobacterium sp. MWU13-2055]NQW90171.1 ABC transporter ATP-binding protein [Curtobacterium sp. VKM Ac-2861]